MLVFKELVHEKLPRLTSHFQKLDYNLGMVVQPWFLCLFTNYLPTHVRLTHLPLHAQIHAHPLYTLD